MYVHGMRYLNITKYMSSTGIIMNFGRLGYSLKCPRAIRLNFTRESSMKGTPLDWALANVFEYFLSHNYCEQDN